MKTFKAIFLTIKITSTRFKYMKTFSDLKRLILLMFVEYAVFKSLDDKIFKKVNEVEK